MTTTKENEIVEYWHTSDLHLDHVNINDLAHRPFDSVSEMNEALITNWNETVKPADVVNVHGDLVMGKRDESLKYVRLLNGYIILTPGNHDHCGPWHKREADMVRLYKEAGIDEITPLEITFNINNQEVLGTHFPYVGDSTEEDRYSEYRPTDNGLWLLHGHVHEKWLQRGRMINVGVDVHNFYPVNRDVLAEMMA